MSPGLSSILNPQSSILKALVLRPIQREKTRTALTIAGIAVGVAVVVAIQLANQSALRAFRESVDAIAGRANYQLVPDVAPLDESVLFQLQPLWREGVRFAPVIDIEGILELPVIPSVARDPGGRGAMHEPRTATRAPDPSLTLGMTPIRLLAVDLFSDLHFRDYRYAKIVTGEKNGVTDYLALFEPDSIILPAPFAREHGLTLGSRITINVLGHRSTLVVRGLLEAEGPATAFNGSIAVCDISVAQRSFGMIGKLSRVDLLVPEDSEESGRPARPREAGRMPALLGNAWRGFSLPPGTRIERPSRRNERVEKMLRAFRVNLFALAGVALLVGMFLVYNTVLISILRRRKDVGMLKTVGVAPRQIFAAFLAEGLLFGVAGSLLGILLGRLLASGILAAVGRTVNTLYVSSSPEAVELTAGVIALGMAVGTILSLLSALQPALEASRVRPSAMIRPGLQQRVRKPRALVVAAIVCFIASAFVARLPPVRGIAVAGYVAVLLVVAGFSLLAPATVLATSRIFSPLLTRAFGIVGRLAAVSLPASLRRTSVAGAALALATGMMVAVALMVGSFRETVRIWVNQTVSSDLWLRPSKGLSNLQVALFRPEVAEELRKVPFVAAVDRVRGKDVLYGDTLIALGSGDFAVAARRGELPMIGHRRPGGPLTEAIRQNGVVVSATFSIKFDKRVGNVIQVPGHRSPITGIYRDYSDDRGGVAMDRALYIRSFGDDAINTIVVYLKP